MRIQFLLFLFSISLFSCDSQLKNNEKKEAVSDSSYEKKKEQESSITKISWSDSAKADYKPDSSLTQVSLESFCDSAIILTYSDGYQRCPPINKKGQWINTISHRKKLTENQLKYVQAILGNPKSFEDPMIVGCYFPSIAIIYYKNNLVIGQSLICLSCTKSASTAKLGNQTYYSPFNEGTLRQLEKLCLELEFPHCKFWQNGIK